MANKIIEALDVPWVVLLSMDSFYKVRESRVLVFFLSYFIWFLPIICGSMLGRSAHLGV